MTVKELIEKLQTLPEDMRIFLIDMEEGPYEMEEEDLNVEECNMELLSNINWVLTLPSIGEKVLFI